MRIRAVVVGLGIQGKKRKNIAGSDVVATVDPYNSEADYKNIKDITLNSFDSALLCTPDNAKLELIEYLLKNGKHVLVEKPLLAPDSHSLTALRDIAIKNKIICYTAYNHRFEPHFVQMKKLLDSKKLGKIYFVRMFYGNGTARLVRDSVWRDQGTGVLPDLGSHLLDTILYWFGKPNKPFEIWSANRFENRAFDHFSFGSNGSPVIQLEITLLSWRNHFYADVFGKRGSAHISSLCKWGPSTFTIRGRKLPSGRPDEESQTLVCTDPTWALEYEYFKNLCRKGNTNLDNDIWINNTLNDLARNLGDNLLA